MQYLALHVVGLVESERERERERQVRAELVRVGRAEAASRRCVCRRARWRARECWKGWTWSHWRKRRATADLSPALPSSPEPPAAPDCAVPSSSIAREPLLLLRSLSRRAARCTRAIRLAFAHRRLVVILVARLAERVPPSLLAAVRRRARAAPAAQVPHEARLCARAGEAGQVASGEGRGGDEQERGGRTRLGARLEDAVAEGADELGYKVHAHGRAVLEAVSRTALPRPR